MLENPCLLVDDSCLFLLKEAERFGGGEGEEGERERGKNGERGRCQVALCGMGVASCFDSVTHMVGSTFTNCFDEVAKLLACASRHVCALELAGNEAWQLRGPGHGSLPHGRRAGEQGAHAHEVNKQNNNNNNKKKMRPTNNNQTTNSNKNNDNKNQKKRAVNEAACSFTNSQGTHWRTRRKREGLLCFALPFAFFFFFFFFFFFLAWEWQKCVEFP